jgi:hypothetical protein
VTVQRKGLPLAIGFDSGSHFGGMPRNGCAFSTQPNRSPTWPHLTPIGWRLLRAIGKGSIPFGLTRNGVFVSNGPKVSSAHPRLRLSITTEEG